MAPHCCHLGTVLPWGCMEPRVSWHRCARVRVPCCLWPWHGVHTDCVPAASWQGYITAGCAVKWENAAFKLSELQ